MAKKQTKGTQTTGKLGAMERFLGLEAKLTNKERSFLYKRKEIYENCDRSTLIRCLLCADLLEMIQEEE